ncbi:MAG: arsenate reductase/protein-tyrosine-phosphatase family protein [Actinomycetota bacterium]
MASILVVCTGNVCRSPVAEGLLRAALERRFGERAPVVASAGTAGWEGAGAQPGSVRAAAELGVDISGHHARLLLGPDLEEASLVLAMAAEHRESVLEILPRAAERAFTLKELVRLLEALPPVGDDADPATTIVARLEQAGELRRRGFPGNMLDEDIADPLGMHDVVYRAIAGELAEWIERLATGLFGRTHAPAAVEGS